MEKYKFDLKIENHHYFWLLTGINEVLLKSHLLGIGLSTSSRPCTTPLSVKISSITIGMSLMQIYVWVSCRRKNICMSYVIHNHVAHIIGHMGIAYVSHAHHMHITCTSHAHHMYVKDQHLTQFFKVLNKRNFCPP